MGKQWKLWQTLFSWAPKITADSDCHHEIKRCLLLGKKAMTNPDNILRNIHHFADKGPYSKIYGCCSSHVWMWELDHKEGWALKNWCFWIGVPQKTLERSNQVNPKGNQPWIFVGRTNAEAPTLWPPDAKSQLIGKDPDAGKDWGQEKREAKDGWMASPTWWTWVWVNSGRWWWTGRPGVLLFMGLQSWTQLNKWTELNWTEEW